MAILLCYLLFTLILLISHCTLIATARGVTFSWQGAGDPNFTYIGDASQYGPQEIKLTIGVADAFFHASAGRWEYAHPIPLCRNTAHASFNTSFTFDISLGSNIPAYRGDGIAFFISPATALPTTLLTTKGLFGGLFGNSTSAPPSTLSHKGTVLAIEFDTSAESWDPNDNHVGLDIGSVISLQTASLNRSGIVLTSGRSITAWISYDAGLERLDIYGAYSDAVNATGRPAVPLLSAHRLRLCTSMLKGSSSAVVGFSSSSRGSVETHDLSSWTWQSAFK